MDPAKIPYHLDTEVCLQRLETEEPNFISDLSIEESYINDTDSNEDDKYLEEEFTSFKDVTRSKKFYLKKKALEETRKNELEDVFVKKHGDDGTDSEEEKILRVVWSEEDPLQNKLVRFVEALEMKKSNSKFTLSMLDEERSSADMESLEGEEVKGRFLEVKDSLEVLATSARNLHGSKYSDWDFTVDHDQEVNRIWRKSDSQWASSLQIEIGKLPSQADQETVLQVLDDGAQGKISVRDVTECLGNLMESANQDRDGYPTKKVSFCAVPSKSCLSKESLSQTSTQSGRSSSHKKVSFVTENDQDDIFDDLDKSNKKVSFYELACDDDLELFNSSENNKIKKSVSFHDSVEFEKNERIKDGSETVTELDSLSSSMPSISDKIMDFCHRDELLNLSNSEKSMASDVAVSGYSLPESFSTYSNHTSLDGSIDVTESRETSNSSLNSSNKEERPIRLLKFLNDQIKSYTANGETNRQNFDLAAEEIKAPDDSLRNQTMNMMRDEMMIYNDNTYDLGNVEECDNDKYEFIRSLIEDSLNRKIEEIDSSKLSSSPEELIIEDKERIFRGLGQTFKLFYDHCKDIVDVDLSKNIGLAMAFQDENYVPVNSNDIICQKNVQNSSNMFGANDGTSDITDVGPFSSNIFNLNSMENFQNDDSYLSADSDGELLVNRVSVPDTFATFSLHKYIYPDCPALSNNYPRSDQREIRQADQELFIKNIP